MRLSCGCAADVAGTAATATAVETANCSMGFTCHVGRLGQPAACSEQQDIPYDMIGHMKIPRDPPVHFKPRLFQPRHQRHVGAETGDRSVLGAIWSELPKNVDIVYYWHRFRCGVSELQNRSREVPWYLLGPNLIRFSLPHCWTSNLVY